MREFLKTVGLAIVFFALGATVCRYYDRRLAQSTTADQKSAASAISQVDLEPEPLWASGFDKVAAPGEVAQPQAPPNRKLRPNEDPAEQTRLRRLDGSNASYSLVDVRDGQNVIDWFPNDHPPMPN